MAAPKMEEPMANLAPAPVEVALAEVPEAEAEAEAEAEPEEEPEPEPEAALEAALEAAEPEVSEVEATTTEEELPALVVELAMTKEAPEEVKTSEPEVERHAPPKAQPALASLV